MYGVSFDEMKWLNLLWAALGVGALAVYGTWQRRRALAAFAQHRLLARLAPRVGWLRPLSRAALIVVALGLLTLAIMHPRWGEAQQRVMRRNIDVMVVLDVSRSMLARDIAPNRLDRAKLSIRDDLLPALGGDRIGLMVFAGTPSLKCPLTTDYGYFRLALADVDTSSTPRGGTLIGDALRRAGEAFDKKVDSHKIVLLITDGEDQLSYPVEAATALWNDYKIPVVAVALGDERQGARIPVRDGKEEYLEYKGETVWSRANFDDLRRIAALSPQHGFVGVGTRNFDLGEIYRRVAGNIRAEEQVSTEKVRLPSRYYPFALAALGLVLLESFIRESPRDRGSGAGSLRRRREAA